MIKNTSFRSGAPQQFGNNSPYGQQSNFQPYGQSQQGNMSDFFLQHFRNINQSPIYNVAPGQTTGIPSDRALYIPNSYSLGPPLQPGEKVNYGNYMNVPGFRQMTDVPTYQALLKKIGQSQ